MAWRLLVLDSGRTWSEDLDADARPRDAIHEQTLSAIGLIGGKGFGGFRDAEEDWPAAGDVELSFWRGRRQQRLRPGDAGRRHRRWRGGLRRRWRAFMRRSGCTGLVAGSGEVVPVEPASADLEGQPGGALGCVQGDGGWRLACLREHPAGNDFHAGRRVEAELADVGGQAGELGA